MFSLVVHQKGCRPCRVDGFRDDQTDHITHTAFTFCNLNEAIAGHNGGAPRSMSSLTRTYSKIAIRLVREDFKTLTYLGLMFGVQLDSIRISLLPYLCVFNEASSCRQMISYATL